MDAKYIIEKLNLKPLEIEGGFYRETYRSEKTLSKNFLADTYTHDKCLKSAIYYLLTPETRSAVHRLKTDEIFHFYAGDPVLMLLLYPDHSTKKIIIGNRIDRGEIPQVLVPAGTWQGSILMEKGKYALMGTTMAPGFDFTDYEEPDKEELIKLYSNEEKLIKKLTPPFAD